MDFIWLQWLLVLLFGVAFFLAAPLAKNVSAFFNARSKSGKQPGVFMLTSSLVISWIFAKSITNAANLGLEFGIAGGIAYATYYLSFIVGGLVIYRLRTKGNFKSIHHFLGDRFGHIAILLFSLLIGVRLFNEVWSNTMVIGSYFGAYGSSSYYASVLIFTFLTLAYTLKGGLRSSLLTDAIQMILFGVLLFVLLGYVLPQEEYTPATYVRSGEWSINAGLDLLFVALIQVFSYPFHDPVLTDRGFISSPKVTLKSYLFATIIGFTCLVLFSLIGVYAGLQGLKGQAAVEVSKLLSVSGMLTMNFIMVTSAASTLDSSFSSFSKLVTIDLSKKVPSVKRGRWSMVILAIAGTLPVFANPEILSATTISGTMVMGLAPVFIFWKIKAPALSFHLSVGVGIIVGILLASGHFPDQLIFSEGKYAALLAANTWGTICCFILYFIPIFIENGTNKKN